MLYELISNVRATNVAIAGIVLVGIYTISRQLEPKAYPLEPRWARSALPLVGHIIGFLRFGNKHLETIMEHDGIRTINFGWKRTYVISSTDLITAAQRQSGSISFVPVVKWMAETLSHFRGDMLRAFDPDSSRVKNKAGLSKDTLSAYHHAFGPGAGSEVLQTAMLDELLRLLDVPENPNVRHDLYSWLKHVVTQATMRSIYGPQQPFSDPKVERAFWDFELSCGPLLMNFCSRWVASKALKARDILDEAFAKYYCSDALDEASELARARYQPPASYGIGPQDIGRLESPFLFAALATTVPACFWVFIDIHRYPNLLMELREEFSHAIVVSEDDGESLESDIKPKRKTFTVQIERLKTSCPLALSVFQETLRRLSIFSLLRVVVSDTMLDDRFFLKAGSLVLLPNNIIHNSTEIYGPDAREFDPYRFLPGRNKVQPVNYRSFGNGPSRCPGRHFASTEIISILCILLMRFDIVPVNGWGIQQPRLPIFSAVLPPSTDVSVQLQPRDSWQGVWKFNLGDAKVKFPLLIG